MIVLTCDSASLGKGRQGVQRVLALEGKIGGRHHVVIIVMKFICWPQSGQRRLRSACVPFREISVRQADSDGTVICSSQPGFVEISFGEIKVMHGQEYPSGLREIFRRNW